LKITQFFAYCVVRVLIVDPSGGMPSYINVIYTSLKVTFSGLQFCCGQYGSIFILATVVAYQICEST